MMRQILFLLAASILAALGGEYIAHALHFAVTTYHTIHNWLSDIFARSNLGKTLSDLLTFFLIPMIITGIISLAYWFARRSSFPYFAYILWGIWLVVTTAVLITLY